MMKVDAIVLLNEKQVWELNSADLQMVKMECIKMARKCDQEQQFRAIADGADTPLAEAYGG